jgi:hypothetical protein
VFFIGCVHVDGVHVDEGFRGVAAEGVAVPFHALVEYVVVPGGGSGFAAENEGDGGVEELEGFGPLVGLFGVVFFGELGDLPGAVAFVA